MYPLDDLPHCKEDKENVTNQDKCANNSSNCEANYKQEHKFVRTQVTHYENLKLFNSRGIRKIHFPYKPWRQVAEARYTRENIRLMTFDKSPQGSQKSNAIRLLHSSQMEHKTQQNGPKINISSPSGERKSLLLRVPRSKDVTDLCHHQASKPNGDGFESVACNSSENNIVNHVPTLIENSRIQQAESLPKLSNTTTNVMHEEMKSQPNANEKLGEEQNEELTTMSKIPIEVLDVSSKEAEMKKGHFVHEEPQCGMLTRVPIQLPMEDEQRPSCVKVIYMNQNYHNPPNHSLLPTQIYDTNITKIPTIYCEATTVSLPSNPPNNVIDQGTQSSELERTSSPTRISEASLKYMDMFIKAWNTYKNMRKNQQNHSSAMNTKNIEPPELQFPRCLESSIVRHKRNLSQQLLVSKKPQIRYKENNNKVNKQLAISKSRFKELLKMGRPVEALLNFAQTIQTVSCIEVEN